MAGVFLGLVASFTTSVLWEDPVMYYCGRKTFFETPVSVSRDPKFVTDVTAEPLQNITLLLDSGSFIIDVTGCLAPMGELMLATGIEITHQKLPFLFNGAIQNLRHLQFIKMEQCGLQELNPGAFLVLPQIETISLRHNEIEYIREGVFNYILVTKLYLSNNSISYIENDAFDNMPNLALLQLDNNKLKYWSTEWFKGSPNVEHLSLDTNLLTKLPANAFEKVKNCYSTSIRLSNNKISFIHPSAFEKLTLLYSLWLDNNKLYELDNKVFMNFQKLFILSLSGNDIKCLSEELLYNFKSNDLILRVENNKKMDCECLRRIETWAKSRNYFFSQRYANKERRKKKGKGFKLC